MDCGRKWPDLEKLSRAGLSAFICQLLSTLHNHEHVPEDVLLTHAISAFEITLNQPLRIPQQSLGGQAAAASAERMAVASPEPVQYMYSLQLSHKCMAQGCNDESCKMCRFNPLRKCTDMFRKPPHAYTTDDPIVAKCQGPLLISIHDKDGNRLKQCPAHLEGCVIMVVALQSRRLSRNSPDLVEGQAPALEKVQEYVLNKPKTGRSLQSLMTADNAIAPHQHVPNPRNRGAGANPPPPDSIFVTVNSSASYTFKNLKLRHSCEALMPGKKPTVRLMFVLADPRSNPAFTEVPQVLGVISEEFLVTTCRAKGRGDGGALLYNTKVSFLPGVGQETERKLANLADSCPPLAAAQLVRPDSITTVGDLGMLMHAIENDYDSKQHLKSCLKLDDPVRWNRLREAVNLAVAVDNRIRVFCSTCHAGSDGDDLYVLFNTHEGRIFFDQKDPNGTKLPDPPSILGMLTRASGSNNVPTFARIKDLSETHQNFLYSIVSEAQRKWMSRGHPGWFVSDWSSTIAAREGRLVNAEAADMPVQLPHLSTDSQMPEFNQALSKHQSQQLSPSPSAQQFRCPLFTSQHSQYNGEHNSGNNLQAAAGPTLPHTPHTEGASASATPHQGSAPAALPPLFSRADSAPLATRPSHTSALVAAFSGGLSGNLDAAPHAPVTVAPHTQHAQQHHVAGHVSMNMLSTQMLPPDAPHTQMGPTHSSPAESLSLQLAQLRDATAAARAVGVLQQQKRRLSSGHAPAIHGQLPASMQLPHVVQHGQLSLPEFQLGPETPRAGAAGVGGAAAGLHQIPPGLQAVYAPHQLQSHPLSPEQQEDQHRNPGSGGHLY